MAELPCSAYENEGQDVQVLIEVALLTVENVLKPQFVHAALPDALLNFPAAHALHVLPFIPVHPALH